MGPPPGSSVVHTERRICHFVGPVAVAVVAAIGTPRSQQLSLCNVFVSVHARMELSASRKIKSIRFWSCFSSASFHTDTHTCIQFRSTQSVEHFKFKLYYLPAWSGLWGHFSPPGSATFPSREELVLARQAGNMFCFFRYPFLSRKSWLRSLQQQQF